MQGTKYVGVIDGFSTSFVNMATEQMGASVKEHTNHLDNWLNFLSSLGLFMGDVTIKLTDDHPDWGKGQFKDAVVKMYYGGLEIGVANYFIDIPQNTRKPLTLSDYSFGLERLAWAINKSPSYFDVIGPLQESAKGKFREMDSIRTMTLMAASGIEPSHKDRGSKLRALVKNIAGVNKDFPIDKVQFYDRWWRKYSNFKRNAVETKKVLQDEWNRNVNLTLRQDLNHKDNFPIEQNPQEYIIYLLQHGVAFNAIYEVIRHQ